MRIPGVLWRKDIDRIKKELKTINKKCIWLSVATISTVVAMFLNIAICVLLTENAKLSEYNNHQNRVFLLFAFCEVVTVILCFFSASVYGKTRKTKQYLSCCILACNAYENRKANLNPDIEEVWYFSSATYRVVIRNESARYSYMLEHYDIKAGWISSYEHARVFNNRSDLDDDISSTFSDVILERLP